MGRDTSLVNAFFSEEVGRIYDENIDYVHVPGNIILPNTKCWMVIDLSVPQRLTLDEVPIFCYRVVRNHDGSSLRFQHVNFIGARKHSSVFPWGRFIISDMSDNEDDDKEDNGDANLPTAPQSTD
ncbi:hypothetical protein RJ035_004245 [Blastomyces gilchristii]